MKHCNRKLLISMAVALGATVSASALAQDPASKPDDSWLSLTGTVTSTTADSFKLDYGDGIITVEMDDWDNYSEAFPLVDGDEVTVYGEVDNDLYESAKVEASSVYVDDLNSFFYASTADEEELGDWVVDVDSEIGDLTYIGEVETVSPVTDSFTIDTGVSELTVDTSAMLYDPLDSEGFQTIEAGDRVSIEGDIDSDFIGNNDLVAESIITLSE